MTGPQFFALIPCGGTGSRAGAGVPKQYRQVAGRPVLAHTLAAFAAVPALAATLVVVSPDDACYPDHAAANAALVVNTALLVADCAGPQRAATVLNGLSWLLEHAASPQDWVLVHDAARCLITPLQIMALLDACVGDPVGGLLAHKLPDTLKQATDGRVAGTLDRSDKWLAQTPQMFRLGPLRDALLQAAAAGSVVTDEASAMEAAGLHPLLVSGSAQNFKLTYPEDFALADAILKSRAPTDRNPA